MKGWRGFALALSLGALAVCPSRAGESVVGIASVIDADTIEIHGTRIRLFGIDAPESRQLCRDAAGKDYRCGHRAAIALADHIGARPLACDPRDTDRYGRTVAVCYPAGADVGAWGPLNVFSDAALTVGKAPKMSTKAYPTSANFVRFKVFCNRAWNLRLLHWQHARLRRFQEWRNARGAPSENRPKISFEHWRDAHRNLAGHHQLATFEEYQSGALSGNVPINLTLSESGHEVPNNDLSFKAIIDVLFVHRRSAKLPIHNREIRRVDVMRATKVRIENCLIENLTIDNGANAAIVIRDSVIGTLILRPHSVGRMDIWNSAILQLDGLQPGSNPFTGSVVIRKLYLPRDKFDFKIDVQMLRNIVACLRELGNSWAAGPFHAAELALERSNDTRINKIWSWIYEVVSDYGNSTGRPAVWLAIYAASTFLFVLLTDGVEPSRDLAGWQLALGGWSACSHFLRALVYPLVGLLSPLSFLGYKPLLIPSEPWLMFVLTPWSMWGLLALALLVAGLRRRFRMSAGT